MESRYLTKGGVLETPPTPFTFIQRGVQETPPPLDLWHLEGSKRPCMHYLPWLTREEGWSERSPRV